MLRINYLWEKQEEILRAILQPPYKVMVKSGHNLGKTFLMAVLVNWWYDSFNPGVVITTAPTEKAVQDGLWKEIRLQRQRVGLDTSFIGPSAPEMRTSPDHYAVGRVARKGEAFQGRHDAKMLFGFDEALGVDPMYWETVRTMFKPQPGMAWFVIFNPTNTTTRAYMEEQYGDWKVFELSSIEHPNIEAGLKGQKLPVPNAVTIGQIDGWVRDWCTPISQEESTATDFAWKMKGVKEGIWRPGPEFESRCLGRWPSLGSYGVWNDALWQAIEGLDLEITTLDLTQIGCDVAGHGPDKTAIHIRRGCCSIGHESYQGWNKVQIAMRLMEIASQEVIKINKERKSEGGARPPITVKDIIIRIDDTGMGGGVTDILTENGMNVQSINSGTTAFDPSRYNNKRSELWFLTAAKALIGLVSIKRLSTDIRKTLKVQAMSPEWWPDAARRRVVEDKDITKKKIGRSPDDLDAMNLSFYEFDVPRAPMQIERSNHLLDYRSDDWESNDFRSDFMGGWQP